MFDDHLYNPVKSYKNIYQEKHNKNVKDFFEILLEKSEIDVASNEETVKKLNKTIDYRDNANKKISKFNGIRAFLITLSVVSLIVGFYGISSFQGSSDILTSVLITVISFSIFISFILLIFKKLNPLIKNLHSEKNVFDIEINKLRHDAHQQVNPLLNLLNSNQHIQLFRKTLPIINIDNSFNIKRYEHLVTKYGLNKDSSSNRSTLFVKSGDISGNPFYIANDLITTLGTKTYSGSIIITYRTYTTVNGKRVAVTNTQTLTATVSKPFPYYNEQSYILYGNDVAPDLIFSRTDSDAENMTQKQIDKEVNRVEKQLVRKSRKAIKKGDDFTLMSNTEFEVLWRATNRNNETQFRLLFSPLAQKQLLELMKEKEIGYGDNFDFIKDKKINIVIPEHLQIFKIDISEKDYYHYDFNVIKNRFITLNNTFFKSIYFGFAPLLSIPLYQQNKPHEYIYKDLYEGYVSFYEHEMVINKLGEKNFAHTESKTRNILKTKLVKSENNKDHIEVKAHGYKVINRIDYVTRMGLDGKLHAIPVPWKEFIPVTKISNVEININDEEPTNEDYRSKIENLFKKIQNRENLTDRELYIVGKYITRIIK